MMHRQIEEASMPVHPVAPRGAAPVRRSALACAVPLLAVLAWLSPIAVNAATQAGKADTNALTYDAKTQTPVPIPPGEQALQTVTAIPWVALPGLRDLEGPAFERDGNLVFSDVAGRRVLRVGMDQKVTTLLQMRDLGPGGLAIHKDGRIFIAAIDIAGKKGAIISVRPDGSDEQAVIPVSAGFMPNDIVFDSQGGFYFTDFRGTATDPKGGVYYVAPDAHEAVVVLPNLAMANGVALSPDGKELWTTEFGRNVLYRVQLADATHATPLGTAIAYYFTGPAPDSMRVDADGNLYVALYGQGRILAFGRNGVPIGQIKLPDRDQGRNLNTTNMAIRSGTNQLYIVTSDSAQLPARIFQSRVFARSLPLYSHQSGH
jgi:lactonase